MLDNMVMIGRIVGVIMDNIMGVRKRVTYSVVNGVDIVVNGVDNVVVTF